VYVDILLVGGLALFFTVDRRHQATEEISRCGLVARTGAVVALVAIGLGCSASRTRQDKDDARVVQVTTVRACVALASWAQTMGDYRDAGASFESLLPIIRKRNLEQPPATLAFMVREAKRVYEKAHMSAEELGEDAFERCALGPGEGAAAVITLEQLRKLCPYSPALQLQAFVDPLNLTLGEFSITRCAPVVLPRPGGARVRLLPLRARARRRRAYEGNEHLGNTEPGDGPRFKGRGLIQITGRKNYALAGEALGLELLEHPELLEQPRNACRSAGWFWTVGAGLNLSKRALEHGVEQGCDLNDLADAGDFEGITLAINGGLNGADDRVAYF
jgi:putative chitinase